MVSGGYELETYSLEKVPNKKVFILNIDLLKLEPTKGFLLNPRSEHGCTHIGSSKIFIAGSSYPSYEDTTELFDTFTGENLETPKLKKGTLGCSLINVNQKYVVMVGNGMKGGRNEVLIAEIDKFEFNFACII